MAKKAAVKGRAGTPLPAAATQAEDGAHGVTRPTKPSALVDTRVIYCGDNLEQLKKLPAACVDLSYVPMSLNLPLETSAQSGIMTT